MNRIQDIRNLSFEELALYFKERGLPTFHARQIFNWIYKKGIQQFDDMNNLSVSLREQLKNDFTFLPARVVQKKVAEDHTMKFLFELKDQQKVETVLIPTATRRTVCVSTQAGCKFGCGFCASGIGGWMRNLSCTEILEEILFAKASSLGHALSHIVFMGTGEPLDTVSLRWSLNF